MKKKYLTVFIITVIVKEDNFLSYFFLFIHEKRINENKTQKVNKKLTHPFLQVVEIYVFLLL